MPGTSSVSCCHEIDDIDAGERPTRRVLQRQGVTTTCSRSGAPRTSDDVALVRIEQLYPFPIDRLCGTVARYRNAREIVWCQEEPQNQGAWYQIRHRLQEPLDDEHELFYAGRMGAAAPAAGYYKLHVEQQEALVDAALEHHGRPLGRPIPNHQKSGRRHEY